MTQGQKHWRWAIICAVAPNGIWLPIYAVFWQTMHPIIARLGLFNILPSYVGAAASLFNLVCLLVPARRYGGWLFLTATAMTVLILSMANVGLSLLFFIMLRQDAVIIQNGSTFPLRNVTLIHTGESEAYGATVSVGRVEPGHRKVRFLKFESYDYAFRLNGIERRGHLAAPGIHDFGWKMNLLVTDKGAEILLGEGKPRLISWDNDSLSSN